MDHLLTRLAIHHNLVLLVCTHLIRVNLVVIVLGHLFKAITHSILTLIDLHHA